MKPRKPNIGESLAEIRPDLALEWHPSKNGKKTPYDVLPGSTIKIWWKCSKVDAHEWNSQIRSRISGSGCPICSNKKVIQSNSLAALNPELAKQWHTTRNGNLTPNEVVRGSHKKVWWKCPEGDDHEWMATVKDRNSGRGCGICAGKIVVTSNCLETLKPELSEEWHPTRNGDLLPKDITCSSNKKVWWKCPKGDDHEWEAIVSDRNRGDSCPVCSNQKVVVSNCLATLNPKLAQQWHPKKNKSLSPFDVTHGSNKKVWWKCPEGDDHEWRTTINHRLNGTGCPFCTNKKVSNTNCLAIQNPDLSKEWHPTKNVNLTPFDIVAGSNKKVWWKCPEGDDHQWETTVNARNSGHECPFCSNRKVSFDNNLAILNPDLAKEWHPTKNGKLKPNDVLSGSHEKVWWKCPKGDDHEWEISVGNRTSGSNCPICSGKKTVKSNCLATLNPVLAKEWHPTKNGTLKPTDVTPGSGKKAWWKCPKGEDHVWDSTISSRSKGVGCPICSNIRAVHSNCLATLSPELVPEWHPTKNENLTPYDITSASGKSVWWRCSKGKNHVWRTSPYHRTVRGSGCPFCTNPSSSPELRILCEIRNIFPSTEHRVKIEGHEVDIFIPELKLGLEYDGEYWHRKKIKQDLAKNDALKNHILLIRIREKGLQLLSDNDIQVKTSDFTLLTMKKILQLIRNRLTINSQSTIDKIVAYENRNTWLAPKEYREMRAARNHIKFEDSIAFLNPEISDQWHPIKNVPLLPDYFSPGSNKKVWWKCSKEDDHEWESTIVNRTYGKNCPFCSNRTVKKSNSLAILNPELATEWHPTKNGELTVYDIGCGSNKKVWWKCPKGDDHEWKALVNSRNKGVGCPICSNKKTVGSNSLDKKNPHLAKEWHPTKNRELSPKHITSGSHKKVWWKCPKGDDHEWQASIKNRNKGSGCPFCANRKVSINNNLVTLYPDLAKEWDLVKNSDLNPLNVTPSSSKKVWWNGACGHHWEAVIRKRAYRGQGCPKCRGKKISQAHRKRDTIP